MNRIGPFQRRCNSAHTGSASALVSQAAIVYVVWCLATGAAASNEITTITGPTMGTSYSVKVVRDHGAEDLQEAIDTRLGEINARMSTYLGDSELSRFNRAPAGEWFSVSDETASVVELAQQISERTNGAFDVTVGPLVRLWNFGAGADAGRFAPPTEDELHSTLAAVGFTKLEVRRDPPALRKSVPGLQVDLSAIAKGYAVDEVGRLLTARGVGDYMVEIGGEIRVAGTRPDGERWRIGIEAPKANVRELGVVLQPASDTAIASSGDYRNFHEHDGTVYSHTIDPRHGRPVKHSLAAVTVLTDDCATADALATALMVLGPNDGQQWADENGVAAILFTSTDTGFKQTNTSNFDTQLLVAPESRQAGNFVGLLLASAAVFGIALIAMSVGVLLGGRRIQGSCGGLAGLRDERGNTMCEACTNPSPTCRGEGGSTPAASSVEHQAMGASSSATSELK